MLPLHYRVIDTRAGFEPTPLLPQRIIEIQRTHTTFNFNCLSIVSSLGSHFAGNRIDWDSDIFELSELSDDGIGFRQIGCLITEGVLDSLNFPYILSIRYDLQLA